MFPDYSYPTRLIPSLVVNMLFGGQRSFRCDGLACIQRLSPPLRVFGKENIPQSGPCLITFNHYHRPGFDAWWLALTLAAVLTVEPHFIMTGELTYPGKWYAPLGRIGSRLLLHRLSKIYGFTSMPPMPPRPKDTAARARSVRQTLAFTRQHPQAILGLAPEGRDHPNGTLDWPAPGAGRFLLLLAEQAFPVLPVGMYEENGEFCLRFGQTYQLQAPRLLNSDEKDHCAAHAVMTAIATQLPPRLRGEFG
jgi:hypothetical protein